MSVKERLKEYIKYSGLSISDFEKSIFASNGYVNSISKGIGADKIEIIIEKYSNLNIEWLLRGKGGGMLNDDTEYVVTENTSREESSLLLSIIERKDKEIMSLMKKIGGLEQQIKQLKESRISDAVFPNTSNSVSELSKEVQGLSDDTNTPGLIAETNNKRAHNNNKHANSCFLV